MKDCGPKGAVTLATGASGGIGAASAQLWWHADRRYPSRPGARRAGRTDTGSASRGRAWLPSGDPLLPLPTK
jgi:NAD(P)-dependent dehydrogenase (short-subunit alcohol dehydrogenase family)